jgi:hypothetical protein
LNKALIESYNPIFEISSKTSKRKTSPWAITKPHHTLQITPTPSNLAPYSPFKIWSYQTHSLSHTV